MPLPGASDDLLAEFDRLGQDDLLLGGQEGDLADLPQVHADRVVHLDHVGREGLELLGGRLVELLRVERGIFGVGPESAGSAGGEGDLDEMPVAGIRGHRGPSADRARRRIGPRATAISTVGPSADEAWERPSTVYLPAGQLSVSGRSSG